MGEDGEKMGEDEEKMGDGGAVCAYDAACEADAGRKTSSGESGRDYSGISADYGGAGENGPD